jgi:mannose/fructose-specific phosphotransferase system component IIA
VSGVNLPMLIRALNYREATAAVSDLAEKALDGAAEGIVRMEAPR